MAPGGRSGGSEKILPICACAGGTSDVMVAAIRAARPVRAMVRSISRLLQANRARDIVQTYPPLASHPVNTANTARKGRLAPFPPHSIPARKGVSRLSRVAALIPIMAREGGNRFHDLVMPRFR